MISNSSFVYGLIYYYLVCKQQKRPSLLACLPSDILCLGLSRAEVVAFLVWQFKKSACNKITTYLYIPGAREETMNKGGFFPPASLLSFTLGYATDGLHFSLKCIGLSGTDNCIGLKQDWRVVGPSFPLFWPNKPQITNLRLTECMAKDIHGYKQMGYDINLLVKFKNAYHCSLTGFQYASVHCLTPHTWQFSIYNHC